MVVAVIALTTQATASLCGQESRPILRYGLTTGVIENANPTDVRAATLVWVQGVAEVMGFYSGAEASVYPSPAEGVSAVNVGKTDVLALSTLEYFSVEQQLKAAPAMVFEIAGNITVEYVLVSREDPGNIANIAGKSIAIFAPNRPWALAELWADVLLADAGVPGRQKAFSSVRFVEKRGHAVMAVFFKQADLAIESRSSFETAVELNPQLGKELKVLARSPQLLPGLVCINNQMDTNQRRLYIEKITRMHELARYRQAFMIMHMTRLSTWDPGFLDSARALVNRQRALQARK
jgi:ABC-type phosphate/phosphonate transport system substrate-binding protein